MLRNPETDLGVVQGQSLRQDSIYGRPPVTVRVQPPIGREGCRPCRSASIGF